MKNVLPALLLLVLPLSFFTNANAHAGTLDYLCKVTVEGVTQTVAVANGSGWHKISLEPVTSSQKMVLSDYDGSLFIGILDEQSNEWLRSETFYQRPGKLVVKLWRVAADCSFAN